MFLGSDFPYKTFAGNEPVFSEYLTRTYHQDFLAKRTLDVVIDDLSGPPRGDRLLDQMIHHGVHLYILRHLMPSAPDTVIFEFTPAQLQWCQDNERALWAHLLTEDLLYSSELRRVQKLIAPAPSVPGMPPEAPGGVANWTGWRIVSALMARKPELTMLDLLAMEDAQTLLEEAKYRPK